MVRSSLLTRHRALTNTNITIGLGSVLREETEHRHEEVERKYMCFAREGWCLRGHVGGTCSLYIIEYCPMWRGLTRFSHIQSRLA